MGAPFNFTNTDVIDQARATDLVRLVDSYGIKMHKQGKDYFGLCPFHSENTPSFTIYSKSANSPQRYHCMGCGADGDAIQFVQNYEGVKFREAVRRIVGDVPASECAPTPPAPRAAPPEVEDTWTPILPTPESAPMLPDTLNRKIKGEWVKLHVSRRWTYRNAAGEVLGHVCRFDLSGGGKEVMPQVWAVNAATGERQWRWLSFPKPRPLYGLDKLAAHPSAQVIVVEGEKAADAGQQLFLDQGIPLEKLVVVSWPGGGKAVKHTDFSPLTGRSVGLWPDADLKPYPEKHERAGVIMPFLEQPGTVAILDVWAAIRETAAGVKFIMPPEGVPDGWDLADPAPQGFMLLEHIRNFNVDPATVLVRCEAGAAAPNELVVAVPEQPPESSVPFQQPRLAVVDVRDGTESTRPLSEAGNALRMLDLHGDRLRYVPEARGWLVWRDGSWQWDGDGAAVRAAAADLPNRIYHEGTAFAVLEAEHFAKWARKSQAAKTVDAAVRLLADRREVRIPLALVDSDPMLGGMNGAREIVDLTTGKVRPAEPCDLVTKSLQVSEVGEAAKASRWLQFLDQIFGGDEELIDWLHRWCGYLLTGSTQEQILLFCFGLGANGKSIFAETLRHILGDYGRSVPVETLCESRRQAGGATPDLADLIGCRLTMSSETEDGQALAESLVKSLVAGDTISARPLYGRPVQFAPAFKLLILGNHRPVIRGTDNGIWRRIRLVPFSRTFEPHEQDPGLLDKLKAEAPHILAWMVAGCLQWRQRRLTDVPAVVLAQTQDYRQEQDIVGQWLAERVDSGPTAGGSWCTSKSLYQDYCEWAEAHGLRPCSAIALGRRLRERGFVSERKSYGIEFQGVALRRR